MQQTSRRKLQRLPHHFDLVGAPTGSEGQPSKRSQGAIDGADKIGLSRGAAYD
jgi:hypothetical protein